MSDATSSEFNAIIMDLNSFVSEIKENLRYADEEGIKQIHKDFIIAYRGQSAIWDLVPAISRCGREDLKGYESETLAQFKRKAKPLLNVMPANELNG